jgi:hypothetical protein
MIIAYTMVMVGAAVYAWRRTNRPLVAVPVVLAFAAGAYALHLVP